MGLLIYDALVLAKVAALLPNARRVLTLGVPTLNFSAEDFCRVLSDRPALLGGGRNGWQFKDHVEFFRGLGFQEIDALDISAYEGANIVGDLNDPALSEKMDRSYDLIYDSGTIEHIFDAPTALRTLSRLTRIGGAIVHASPANGFMDHGLWQCSPDLFRAFYRSAGFSILTSSLMVLGQNVHAVRADENFYRSRGRRYIVEQFPEAIAVFAAIKRSNVDTIRVQLQDYYNAMHQGIVPMDESSFFIEYGSPKSEAGSVRGRKGIGAYFDALRKTIASARR